MAADIKPQLAATVESPLGAQTVLGDRHDLFIRRSIASSVDRLRNSLGSIFQRLDTQTNARRNLYNVRARI